MLEFRNLDVNVGRTPILRDVSVSIESGKITTIVGPNGCGKTTLLQTLIGVSKVVSGEIWIDGDPFLALAPRERAKRLSFLPQMREGTLGLSVKNLVEHGRFPYMGFARKMSEDDLAAVEDAIRFTALEEYKSKLVHELSGGLQQRAYLAMQLAQNCPYMVLDEPMNYLDFPSQREMNQLIRELKASGKTIVMVLHDLGQALQISDQIVVMKERKVVGTGSPAQCLASGILDEVFQCKISKVNVHGVEQYILQ